MAGLVPAICVLILPSHRSDGDEEIMTYTRFNTALIVGAGAGLSASLARVLSKEGIKVALAARSTDDLNDLAVEAGAETFSCDASKRVDVEKLFANLDATVGAPEDRKSVV